MKHLLILALLCGGTAQSQIKNFYPKKVVKPDLSAKREKEINRQNELLQKKVPTASEQKELNILLEKYGEVVENAWDIIDGGCSWYCGGGNYKIKASSSLGDSYKAEFANDLSYKTAWVEGKKDEGVGEYLEYYFKNDSPRITEIIISNGYMKSEETWKNNNRVKKLKLYVNDAPFGILNLKARFCRLRSKNGVASKLANNDKARFERKGEFYLQKRKDGILRYFCHF